jgi:hypothetical protein
LRLSVETTIQANVYSKIKKQRCLFRSIWTPLDWTEPELEFVEEAMSSRKTPTTTESLKSDLFSLIDTLINEIEERFGEKQRLMYRAFAELLDLDDKKVELSFEAVFEFFNVSSLDQQFFLAQWKLFQQNYNDELNKASTLKDVIDLLIGKEEYGLLFDIYKRASVIPVTSAQAERAFSCLNRIKTYLGATMGQAPTSSLAILSINSDIKIDVDKVIDKFAKYNKNRRVAFD